MLQIGSETTEDGISLSNLKIRLQNECLVSNPQNTEHIEQWFNWAFEHKSFGCHCPIRQSDNDCGCNNDDPCSKYDHDNNCNRFLNKDSIIEFSLLEQSHKQTEQLQLNRQQVNLLQVQLNTLETQIRLAESNSSESKTQAQSATKLAIWAIIISAIMGIPDWIGLCNNSNSNELKDTQTAIQDATKDQRTLQYLTPEYLYQLDSVRTVNDSLRIDHFLEKTNLLEISKTLKYINQKLYKINKFNEQNKNE